MKINKTIFGLKIALILKIKKILILQINMASKKVLKILLIIKIWINKKIKFILNYAFYYKIN